MLPNSGKLITYSITVDGEVYELKFRLISYITFQEASEIVSMLVEGSSITRIEQIEKLNYVNVFFKIIDEGLDYDEEIIPDDNEYKIALFPDSVQDSSFYIDCNKMWEYRQFTIAKGFSELWKGNLYTDQ